ncbi:hypothetical protein CYLTODRAFT_102492 [Cylindrobasidium torrendii FP15055 ss-10]|uniref:Uncharacterized protein n=1 Tax=Cylindrobasidium torrendii FP15055 ss-10 TaxID=1314674 RepID=A0A0D7B197_9AGAR|nr:hypothetical protein CYLTODRAFT_102492 [Cylindrobasidium torrendii FP15055 ss-10]
MRTKRRIRSRVHFYAHWRIPVYSREFPALFRRWTLSLSAHLRSLANLLLNHTRRKESRRATSQSAASQSIKHLPHSLRELERHIALFDGDDATAAHRKRERNLSSLRWLFKTTSHRSVKFVIQQSLGAQPRSPGQDSSDSSMQEVFDNKDYRPTVIKGININLTQAEIDTNLRLLRSYATMAPMSLSWKKSGLIACLVDVPDVRVLTQTQRLELRRSMERAFSDAREPLYLPVLAWQLLFFAANVRSETSTLLQGQYAALRICLDIVAQVKSRNLRALGVDEDFNIVPTWLDYNVDRTRSRSEVSPLTLSMTLETFLIRAGIAHYDVLGGGSGAPWVYADNDDDKLFRPRIRLLLDINQCFVMAFNTGPAPHLNGTHLEGLWEVIKTCVDGGTSLVEDSAVCIAIHSTLETVINTKDPDNGLQPYPHFAGAFREMLATYALIANHTFKPTSPPTSLLLHTAARCDQFHKVLHFGIYRDVPEAYDIFMNTSPEGPTSQNEDDIGLFVTEFAQGAARSTSRDAAETWKDEAERKRCAEWFLDKERFPRLVQQAGKWANHWDYQVLDKWHPQLDVWYYQELGRVLSEMRMGQERHDTEALRLHDSAQAASVIDEQEQTPEHAPLHGFLARVQARCRVRWSGARDEERGVVTGIADDEALPRKK